MALQIVQFRNNVFGQPSSIRIKQENLDTILNTVGNRPIAIISVCGPANLGKSFLLNNILRCLEAAETGTDSWVDKPNQKSPLNGFRWGDHANLANDFSTKGICVWNRPFMLKNPRGREFAVLVLDTLPIFDMLTHKCDSKTVVGLCMLLSSLTILNLSSDSEVINEVFKSLKIFCEYGNIVKSESTEKPFQKLCMVIRDWEESSKYSLGKDGGSKFLKSKLKLDQKYQPMVEKEICNFFEDVDCFLMPVMGASAKGRNYDGNYLALSKLFRGNMEQFISNLVENDVRPRKIGRKLLTATDLSLYLNAYVAMFDVQNQNFYPSAQTIFTITQCISGNLINKSLERYKKPFAIVKDGPRYFTQRAFDDAHKEGEKRAFELLNEAINTKSNKDNNQKHNHPLHKTLKSLIKKEWENLKAANEGKRKQALAYAELAVLELIQIQFIEKFNQGKCNYDEQFIRQKALTVKNAGFTEFLNRLCGNESEKEIQDLWSPIQTQFDKTVTLVLQKSGHKKGSTNNWKPKSRLAGCSSRAKSASCLVDREDECFSCPICFEVPKAKVFQCRNGHLICEKCCEKIKQCPQCRVHLAGEGKIRNRAVEEILEKLNMFT